MGIIVAYHFAWSKKPFMIRIKRFNKIWGFVNMRSYFPFHKHFYELDIHPEPSQISQMEPFAKIAIFSKKLHFRCLTGFWICLCLIWMNNGCNCVKILFFWIWVSTYSMLFLALNSHWIGQLLSSRAIWPQKRENYENIAWRVIIL